MRELLNEELSTLREQIAAASHASAIINPTPNTQPLPKPPKIILNSFDGSNPLDWIFQAEQYFEYTQTLPHQRLQIVPFFMQGSTLAWYKWMHSNHQLSSWDAFTRDLELRFGPPTFSNHQAALFKLKQTGTVMDYQQQFESLSNRVEGLPPTALLNCFISGLKMDIQREIAVLQPKSLPQAIGMAKLLEAKFADSRSGPSRYSRPASTAAPAPSLLGAAPSPSSFPIRRLSPSEMDARRAKGLCFNCDDKFSPRHRCKAKQFLLLLTDSEDQPPPADLAVLEPSLLEPDPGSEDSPPLCEHFQLSRTALVGSLTPKTLRVQGMVRELVVTILIDSGSSHNIMQPRIAEFLQFPITAIAPFSVIVGNDQSITCAGSCSDVPVKLGNEVFSIPFYILPIHGADLVLGVQWLQTLGAFLSDYTIPAITFSHNGKQITLTGPTTNSPTLTTFSQFCRYVFTDSIAALHAMSVSPLDTKASNTPCSITTDSLPPPLPQLLHKYNYVFSQPQGLPPHRSQDHHIHLLPGSQPVNVKPYRYPHFQKEVITNMIKEMMKEGIIKPSTSPFSSPVLLVRKKDGTWRFCVDYRALNAITIKDRFPIPTVDELLDELHGSQVFSKLDLRSGYHQILLNPTDTFKTAFRTVDGHFEFLVVPFGLSNAPTTFQATMNDVFRAFLCKFVLVFF